MNVNLKRFCGGASGDKINHAIGMLNPKKMCEYINCADMDFYTIIATNRGNIGRPQVFLGRAYFIASMLKEHKGIVESGNISQITESAPFPTDEETREEVRRMIRQFNKKKLKTYEWGTQDNDG